MKTNLFKPHYCWNSAKDGVKHKSLNHEVCFFLIYYRYGISKI